MPKQIDHGFFQEFTRTPEEQHVKEVQETMKELEKQVIDLTNRVNFLERVLGRRN